METFTFTLHFLKKNQNGFIEEIDTFLMVRLQSLIPIKGKITGWKGLKLWPTMD